MPPQVNLERETSMSDLGRTMRMACLIALAGLIGQGRAAEQAPAPGTERVVTITAKRFEFSPKEVKLERGKPVRLQIHSEDVVHGYFSRQLGIDTEISPGKTTEVVITPKEAGRFLVICDHFCGSGHGGMNMTFVVE
jgi:cytochrome c oxidase subunit 2